MYSRQTTVKNWPNLPISNPEPDLHNSNAHTKFGEKPIDIYSSYDLETKILMCHGWITVNKWWNLQIWNPKLDLCNTNAHTKFGENPLTFIQVIVQGPVVQN